MTAYSSFSEISSLARFTISSVERYSGVSSLVGIDPA